MRKEVKGLQKGRIKDDTSFVYGLPYEQGKAYCMIQGYFSPFTHKERAALDFKMKRGTKICAARGGVVVRLKEDGDRGGLKRKYRAYGNYVIVRYTNDQLPQSTRDLLTSKGFAGGAIFVMYAHLDKRLVQQGAILTPGQQIGTCGNTGNSEAPHLHLEIRAAKDPNFVHWANIRSGVMDAVVLFKR